MSNLLISLLNIDKNFKEDIQITPTDDELILKEFSSGSEERIQQVLESSREWKMIIDDAKEKKMLVKDLAKIEDVYIESLYAHGFDMYNKGLYRDAFNIFRFLLIFNLSDFRFAYGLARTLDALGHLLIASQVYRIAAGLDPDNPFPCYCAAECLLQIGDTYTGLICLEQCLYTAKETPEHKELKERALLVYQGILAHLYDKVEEKKATAIKDKKKTIKKE